MLREEGKEKKEKRRGEMAGRKAESAAFEIDHIGGY